MEAAVVLLTLASYGLAGYLWWRDGTPIYACTLLSGHIAALVSPLWIVLYGVSYRSDLAVMSTMFAQPLLRPVFLASAWIYSLPALLVLYLYRSHWWSPGYLAGLLTYAIFLLYHLIIETLGLQMNVWSYSAVPALPLGISHALLSAVMAGGISLALLYGLLLIYQFAWLSMLVTLLPATLVLSLLIHGVLGAPLWIARLLTSQEWAVSIGLVSTLALLGAAVHIIARGLENIDQGRLV